MHLLIMLPFALLSFLVSIVLASSSPPAPLRAIDSPSTLALEILPRNNFPSSHKRNFSPLSPSLLHTDHFRLTLTAFSRVFHLHLRPNEDFIHPDASIKYYAPSSTTGSPTLVRVAPLNRENVLVYHGDVVHAEYSEARMREDTAKLLRSPDTPGTLGWARITVHHRGDTSREPIFEGAFTHNGDTYHIMTSDRYLRTKHAKDPHPNSLAHTTGNMVIFRDSDLTSSLLSDDGPAPDLLSCGHDHFSFNTDSNQNPLLLPNVTPTTSWWTSPWQALREIEVPRTSNGSISKRDDVAGGSSNSNFVNSIGSTAGCPLSQKLLYMGVATDCQYTAQHGSVENATSAILSNWNTASALYKSTFNVSLGIIHLEVHEASCPTSPDPIRPWNVGCGSVTLNDRLSLFSQYRGTLGDDGAGLWHLMSGCPTGTEVGVAWLGTLCKQQAAGSGDSIVSGTAVSTGGRTEWQVVAHEIGHNFGAIHDCQSDCNGSSACCPLSTSTCDAKSNFIMSPVTSVGEANFSPCSIGNICSLMEKDANGVNTTCLIDPNEEKFKIISLQQCGNGIVEDGEDCDPGSNSSSPCCDASTCKFTANSKCDPANDACCTTSCQFAPATQVCRPAIGGGCDIAETCTGTSAQCPPDRFHPNGESCGNGLACASGQCTSNSQQCALVGMSMNLTTACPSKASKTCQISCQSPTDSNTCVVLQSTLVDGSPCGYGGTCLAGDCQSGPLLDTIKAWYTQNLQISIPVTVVVVIVAILLLWSIFLLLKRCCCGGARTRPRRPEIPGPAQRIPSWSGPLPVVNRPTSPPQIRVPPNARLSIPPLLRAGTGQPNLIDGRQELGVSGNPGSATAPRHWVDPTPWNG